MNTMSVDGILVPSEEQVISDEYQGHFLKVRYGHEISNRTVFRKERVDVSADGNFSFSLPQKTLVANQSVTIDVYAPNGQMLVTNIVSYDTLKAANLVPTELDEPQVFQIEINPYIIVFNPLSPAKDLPQKVRGRVIDSSGEKKGSGLQIILMASDDANAAFSVESFTPVLSALTDKDGYFFAQAPSTTYQQAFGYIAGSSQAPIPISLEDNKIPKNILLVSDLSLLNDLSSCGCNESVPPNPDHSDLVNSSAFSQDVGGHCVDFTVPDRTLEEFSFYHTVRTTEPEIRGLTINVKDTNKLKSELATISQQSFALLGRLNNSFRTLSMVDFSVEEASKVPIDVVSRERFTTNIKASRVLLPNYKLKLDIGAAVAFSVNTNDLLAVDKRFAFTDIISIVQAQAQRKKKLQQLHQKLAAAYCGKNGIEDAKSFCEELTTQDALNRQQINTLVDKIGQNIEPIKPSDQLLKLFKATLIALKKLAEKRTVDGDDIRPVARLVDKTLTTIENEIEETPVKVTMLGLWRSVAIELASAQANNPLSFEPCPLVSQNQRMGIVCLIQKYSELKEVLENNALFTLGEILMIKEHYLIFIDSIRSFVALLDEYHGFYTKGIKFAIELVDDYFVQQYDSISSTLTAMMGQLSHALNKINALERAYIENHPGRMNLTVETGIDWDETPTIYENTTIAHGHILHFKQKWKAAGYSLGNLLYSLPLAPCQEKQIAIVDWDRKESGTRDEQQVVAEDLQANISRDREISEMVRSSFGESINASSHNSTSSTSAAIGGGIGGFIAPIVFGIAGGVSHSGASSSSNASQNSARNLSANSLSNMQDSTSQSASSLRSQRNTVIQSVAQNESVSVQTEVVKNNNHCHAMTVEYFEVLKHYTIEQHLADVQECLFVPMPMSQFDNKKVLRWTNTLQRTIYGRKLRKGFSAIERIDNNYVDSTFPQGSYCDEDIEEFSGHFTISFELQRPVIKEIDEATKTEEYDLSIPFPWFFGRLVFHLEREVPLTEAEKDRIFELQYVPNIVRSFVDEITIIAIADDGAERELDLDLTLLSSYRKGVALKVSIATNGTQQITRKQIKHLRFRANTEVKSFSKIILRSAYLSYATPYLHEYIVRKSRVNNDIINIENDDGTKVTDAALMYTPLNHRENQNPKKEDREAATALVGFLNEHLELSHKIIWSSMDASRLFGLLDGYIAPHSGQKSVASVVDNKIMGVIGNNLVLKVIPGEKLDPVFKHVEDLFAHYQPTTPLDPYRVSVPTKGVYAESVMGKCNSCEEIDETKHWRFDDEPCGTKPPAIDPVSTASRRSEPGNLQVKDLPANIINLQTPAALPDPSGLSAALELLGKSGVFKDLTGLEGTQANALGALKTTSQSVTDLAAISKDFASLAVMANQKKDGAKQIEQIKKLNKEGFLSDEDTKNQIVKVLDSFTDAASSVVGKKDKENAAPLTSSPEIKKAITNASNSEGGNVNVTRGADGTETVSVANDSRQTLIRIIENSDLTPSARSFNPAVPSAPGSGDKTGSTNFSVRVSNMPAGSSIRWSVPPANAGELTLTGGVSTLTGESVTIAGIIPGTSNVDVSVRDADNHVLQSIKLPLSIPQFVTVDENETEFNQALTDLGLLPFKNDIVKVAKATCDILLTNINVRTLWNIGTFAESTPAHLMPSVITAAVIRNQNATSKLLSGETIDPVGATGNIIPNRRIDIYPNAFDDSLPGGAEDPTGLDVITQALLIQLASQGLGADPALEAFATNIYGRLIGEVLAHEVVHALLWDLIPPTGHNNPPLANGLMNDGSNRHFSQRTGMIDNVQTSPIDPDNFTDNGLSSIGKLQSVNQAIIDLHFPVLIG